MGRPTEKREEVTRDRENWGRCIARTKEADRTGTSTQAIPVDDNNIKNIVERHVIDGVQK